MEHPVLDAQLILSIVVIIYYLCILCVTFTAKSEYLTTAFFHIFNVTGICDILGILAQEWLRIEVKSSFGPSFELVTRLMMAMTLITFYIHIFGCFLMTCNTFTAVRFPQQQSHIWCKRNVWALLIFEIVLSIAIHYQLIVASIIYGPKPGGGWIIIGRTGSFDETRFIDSVISIVYEITSIVIIMYTTYLINKQLRKSRRKMAQEMRLLLVTAVNCILNILECIYDASFLLQIEPPAWLGESYEINFLLKMSVNSYTILFLSSALRREIRQRLCWKSLNTHSLQTTVRTF